MNKRRVYVLLAILFAGTCVAVLFGAAVRQAILGGPISRTAVGKALLAVVEFPSLVKLSLVQTLGHGNQVIDDRFPHLDGFSRLDEIQAGALEDDGYLLLSSYDANKGQPTVQLIRIADQQILYEWVPDIAAMEELTNSEINKHSTRIGHPFLAADGGLMFHDFSSQLFRINPTSGVELFADGYFHHSIEQDAEGNIWVCSRMEPSSYAGILNPFADDSIAQISPAGEVLFEKSVARILEENGYRGLLAAGFSSDPIHLNDVQPALTDSAFWERGDLLLSMRHRSTIALYRPSTNKIVWLRTGPWMNQHDVDFINDHQISVFGNDIIFGSGNNALLDGHNNVYIYDFATATVTTPYARAMESMEVRTIGEGLCEVLPNGDVFIEETTYGRILRLTPATVKWEYVRRVDEDHLAHFSWSRYLTEEQVQKVLPNLQNGSHN